MLITIARDVFTCICDTDAGMLSIVTPERTLPIALQGAVNRPDAIDAGTRWQAPERMVIAGGERLILRAVQSVWAEKFLQVDILSDTVLMRVCVRGHGAVERVVLGAGFPIALAYAPDATLTRLPWARRTWTRSWSGSPIQHRHVFNPQPNAYDEQILAATVAQRITCATTFGPDIFNTFFAPPIYTYIFDGSWNLGLVARPGANTYHHFDYSVGDGWGFEVHFDCKTAVDGMWESPTLRIAPCADVDAGLADQVAYMKSAGCAVRYGRRTPDWARRPMLCGWGQQTAWAHQQQRGAELPVGSPITSGAGGYASQVGYQEIVTQADQHELPFGVLTIDMGWSTCLTIPRADARLWPDLKGFIAAQHARGRKVLLWLATWNPGGLDESLRMPHESGLPDACDPTHPMFRQELLAAIEHCISPSGLDADGFKLDFTGDLVRGAGYRPAVTGTWGMELLKEYVALIHTAMHAAKADSVLETHCANPYFADVTDYLRLNDIFTPTTDVRAMMSFRARMAHLTNPDWALDTDNDPFISRAGWMDYMRHQARIGVPSLYTLSHLSFPGPDGTLAAISAADLAEIAGLWRDYLKGLHKP